jgi:hypothetical protein
MTTSIPSGPATSAIARLPLTLPVSGAGGEMHIAADAWVPSPLADRPVLLVSMAGGGVSRGYLDLGGAAGGDASYARSMAARGHVVVALDPVGTGESTIPDDGFSITIESEARWVANAVRELRTRTIAGARLASLPAVGVGHSAGAMIMAAVQGAHASFDAVALLGFSTNGLPEYVPDELLSQMTTPEAARALVPDLARQLFGGAGYFGPASQDDDSQVGRWIHAVRTEFPATLGATALLPGNVAPETARITVPVFLGVSEHDIAGPARLAGASFPGTPDFTAFVLPGATHEIFAGPHNGLLYDRLEQWLPSAVMPRPALASPVREAASTPAGPASARYDLQRVPLGTVLDDPEARAIVDRVVPGMSTHRMIRFARKLAFTKVLGMAAPQMDPAVADRLVAELSALPPRRSR